MKRFTPVYWCHLSIRSFFTIYVVYERVGTEANCHSNDGNEAAVEWAVQNEKQKNRDDKDKVNHEIKTIFSDR